MKYVEIKRDFTFENKLKLFYEINIFSEETMK
jgi:hypothetical protein